MKNKLFICFKPLVLDSKDTNDNHVDHCDVSLPSCLILASDQNKKSSSTIKSSLWDSRNGKVPCHHKGRKKSNKALSQGLQAIYDFSMRTTVPDRNLYQLALLSKSNCARKNSKRLDLTLDDKPVNRERVEANSGNSSMRSVVSSSSVSSSSMSRPSSEANNGNCGMVGSRSISFNNKTQNTTTRGEKIIGSWSSNNPVLYLMVFTLFCTIFMGKIYAVSLTLLWLCFTPRRILRNTGIPRRGGLNGRLKLRYDKAEHLA